MPQHKLAMVLKTLDRDFVDTFTGVGYILLLSLSLCVCVCVCVCAIFRECARVSKRCWYHTMRVVSYKREWNINIPSDRSGRGFGEKV